jgi:RimJ/RimL family protein N-acetyltransferase
MRRALCNGQHNGTVSFRPARPQDAESIAWWLRSEETRRHIHWDLSTLEQEREKVLDWIRDPNGVLLVIRRRGERVGFVQLEHLDEHRRLIWLSLIVLAPEETGKRIGTEALRLLLSRIQGTRVIDRILLAVNSDNVRAMSAYRRLGFSQIDSRDSHTRSHDGKAVSQNIMECALRWHAPARCHCMSSPVQAAAHGGG